jgi:hypothetical protein
MEPSDCLSPLSCGYAPELHWVCRLGLPNINDTLRGSPPWSLTRGTSLGIGLLPYVHIRMAVCVHLWLTAVSAEPPLVTGITTLQRLLVVDHGAVVRPPNSHLEKPVEAHQCSILYLA